MITGKNKTVALLKDNEDGFDIEIVQPQGAV